jgi:hypothetical protein
MGDKKSASCTVDLPGHCHIIHGMKSGQTWEILLVLARASKSESFARRALGETEAAFGPESPETGLCLMDLADCLEQSGKFHEAETVTERYRAILCRIAREMGI